MKKFLALMLILVFISGCQLFQGNLKPVTEKISEITIRTAAFYIAKNNPEIVEPGIIACKIILQESSIDAIIRAEMEKILNAYRTQSFVLPPTVSQQDIMDILAIMGVELPKTDTVNIDMESLSIPAVKFVAKSILQGLEMART